MSGSQHGFQSSYANSPQGAMRSQFVGGPGNQMPGLMGTGQQPDVISFPGAGMVNQQGYGVVGMQAQNPQQAQQMQLQQQQLQLQQQQQQQQQQQLQQQQQQQLQQQQHQQQQQQQQQPQQQPQQVGGVVQSQVSGPGVGPQVNNQQAPNAPAQGQQSKQDLNTASLCRFGQETVQDIVSRTQDVFTTLKTLQPPNGTAQGVNASTDRKTKVSDQLRTIKFLFKRLRIIYEKCNENCQLQGMEYMHIESLIPLKEEWDMKSEERKTSESYRLACDESKEVMEQVALKNRHLKEVIDQLRRIISEINTMLMMRRS